MAQKQVTPKRMGRPPKGDDLLLALVQLRLPKPVMERIDEMTADANEGRSPPLVPRGQILRDIIDAVLADDRAVQRIVDLHRRK
ncbi:MAG: hypothetical protein CTY20_00815 [Hyphomicrobium sp.]|nr:MAG: hypothetical protein CTY20_00815 [Hyphomicrobium sp.]